MVLQTDGRVLYDTDQAQIGRMMFEDPLYTDHPDLLDAAQRVVAELLRHRNLQVCRRRRRDGAEGG